MQKTSEINEGLEYRVIQDYPNAKFTLVLFDDKLGSFKHSLFTDLTGKKIKTTGKIIDYKGNGRGACSTS